MTALVLAGAGVVLGGRAGRSAHVLALVAAIGVGGVVLVAVATVLWQRMRHIRTARHAAAAAERHVSQLADLVALGLTAGHNVSGSLAMARPHVHTVLGRELDRMLRFARHRGVAPALAAASGPGADLFRTIARSVISGASALDAVTALAKERRAAAQAREVERARRLPVKMLFPLALLVLPGFTLVLLGPAVVGAIDRLGF